MLPINLLNILKQYHQGRAVCFTDWKQIFGARSSTRDNKFYLQQTTLFISLLSTSCLLLT